MSARLAAALGIAAALQASRAGACDSPSPQAHTVDATLEDSAPPEPPADISVLVRRGTAPKGEGCGASSTSCDDIGSIQLLLTEPATDDQTAPQNMGYLIEVVDGAPPGGLTLPADALRAMNGTTLPFAWVDDNTDAQEIIAFSVTLTPVDEAGNVGQSSDPIRIYDPGSAEGCATARPPAALDAGLLLLAMAGLRRAFKRGC